MRLKLPNYFRFASMGLLGLAFAHSVHAAVITHAVGEPSFGSAVAGGGQFSYANTASWSMNGSSGNWFYNSDYVNSTSDKRPLPRTGDVALHTIAGNNYTYQLLGDNFVEGRTYNFSVWASGDTDSDATSDRHWIYIYDGVTIPGAFSEGSDLVRRSFFRDGSIGGAGGVGTGASSATNDGWSIGDGSSSSWVNSGGAWGLISISYTATAAEDGHPIGIGIWGGGDASFDDVVVTSIPEPTLTALLALSGGLLLRRRRKAS